MSKSLLTGTQGGESKKSVRNFVVQRDIINETVETQNGLSKFRMQETRRSGHRETTKNTLI